ncbi:hypothetical protein [Nocardia carnea]|uniref:WXG100 family type VII secretion target n=1 Tax=Nocardia carnea TaxID=37328 RepID=A0ABW7TN16_9NOCA|nr:hypothetical protein [Nocardia carnea]
MAGSGNFTRADETTLMDFANGMNGPLQTLERNLGELGGSQNLLQEAFKGQAGGAVFNAFGNVLDTGKQLASYIEQILNMIQTSAGEFAHEDAAALRTMLSGMEDGGLTDGGVATGGASGTWTDGTFEQNWDPTKVKGDWN